MLAKLWEPTEIEMDSVDWTGNTVHLTGVPALRNKETRKIRVYPEEVAKAELQMIAKAHGIQVRDIALLLLLYAKPGPFKGGEILYKYHVNKMLFYQWKFLEKELIGDAFVHDNFIPAERGPVPEHIEDELAQLKEQKLITTENKRWGKGPKDESVKVKLTPQGEEIAHEIWKEVAFPFKETTLKVKEQIFPLDPKTIRERVHREYPEYKKTYTELDTD